MRPPPLPSSLSASRTCDWQDRGRLNGGFRVPTSTVRSWPYPACLTPVPVLEAISKAAISLPRRAQW